MKKALFGALAIAVLFASGFASAADLSPAPIYTKAPPAPAAPIYNWTGFYLGGDVGGAWSSNTATFDPLPTPGGVAFGIAAISGSNRGSSAIGGLHAGYNWQFAPTWVTGIEGDWSWAKAGGSLTGPWVAIPPALLGAPPNFTTMSSKLDWVTSLRARFGYLVTPNVMAYATGGVAWAKLDYSASAIGFLYSATTAFSDTQTGYVVGGGLEWAITNNWLLRAEYLFYRFNNAPNVVVTAIGSANPSGFSWSATTLSVARAGLSYKF
jgi:outer membrane immunogenic protein